MSDEGRKKRTITEIRDSKRTAEKMVYTSVPDYTSARWAEMVVNGLREFVEEVKAGKLPDEDHSYAMQDQAEYEKFLAMVETRKQI